MKKLAVACALMLGLPVAAAALGGGCDICRTILVCEPECAFYSVCRSAPFAKGRDDCWLEGGTCYVGGGFCQWADLRPGEDPKEMGTIFRASTECSAESGT